MFLSRVKVLQWQLLGVQCVYVFEWVYLDPRLNDANRCLKLAVADLTIGQFIASNLFDITEQLAGAEIRLNLFPFTESLLQAATHLFAAALRYIVKTIFLLQKRLRAVRALKAGSGDGAKFKKMYQDFQQHSSWLDREFSNAQEIRRSYFLIDYIPLYTEFSRRSSPF